jgi:hypothetical protein
VKSEISSHFELKSILWLLFKCNFVYILSSSSSSSSSSLSPILSYLNFNYFQVETTVATIIASLQLMVVVVIVVMQRHGIRKDFVLAMAIPSIVVQMKWMPNSLSDSFIFHMHFFKFSSI